MNAEPRVRLRESGDWSEWHLTRDQAAALSDSELVDIRTGTGETWKLRAKGMVGAARIGHGPAAVHLSIAPKIPVDRLLYLLGHAAEHAKWSDSPVAAAARPDLLPAIAYAFTRAAHRALCPGPLLGYREVEDSLPVLRGRLRSSAQLRRHPGLALPLEVTYEDHTADIPENQLLLGAIRRLLRTPGLAPANRTVLQGLAARLDGIAVLVPGTPPPSWARTRLNLRYHQALGLADLILRGASYELDDGRTVAVDGLLLRMWQVYETFLGQVLGTALRERAGGRTELKDKKHYIDTSRKYRLKPDLVHYLAGMPAIVADAKYKGDWSRADLYQMLAYCVRLGLDDGHLLYAHGREDVVHVPVTAGTVRIHRHVLDLSLPHQRLEARVGELADSMIEARSRGFL